MPGLILNMSLPLMFSLLIQTLYNIVDSIFVARLSQNALTAVSLAYPMQILMIAVSVGTALRQVVLPVPLVWLLARTLGIGQAWYASSGSRNPPLRCTRAGPRSACCKRRAYAPRTNRRNNNTRRSLSVPGGEFRKQKAAEAFASTAVGCPSPT